MDDSRNAWWICVTDKAWKFGRRFLAILADVCHRTINHCRLGIVKIVLNCIILCPWASGGLKRFTQLRGAAVFPLTGLIVSVTLITVRVKIMLKWTLYNNWRQLFTIRIGEINVEPWTTIMAPAGRDMKMSFPFSLFLPGKAMYLPINHFLKMIRSTLCDHH